MEEKLIGERAECRRCGLWLPEASMERGRRWYHDLDVRLRTARVMSSILSLAQTIHDLLVVLVLLCHTITAPKSHQLILCMRSSIAAWLPIED